MVLAAIGILILMFGSLKVFLWSCESLRDRQQGYDRTRARAASSLDGEYVPFEPGTELDIFGERQ